MHKGAKKPGIAEGEAWRKAKHPSGAVCWIQGLTNSPWPMWPSCRPALEGIPDPCPSSSKDGCQELAEHWPSLSPGAKSRGELTQPPAKLGFEAG